MNLRANEKRYNYNCKENSLHSDGKSMLNTARDVQRLFGPFHPHPPKNPQPSNLPLLLTCVTRGFPWPSCLKGQCGDLYCIVSPVIVTVETISKNIHQRYTKGMQDKNCNTSSNL